jgi:hypothetical protein
MRFVKLATLFLLSFLATAKAPAQSSNSNFAPSPDENSLLWKISGMDLSHPSYLFGTIHIIGKDDFFLSDSTRSFINQSELITFEINMEEINNLPSQLGLIMKSFMNDGKSLRNLLSPEDYQLVNKHFNEMGIPLFMFERMKPLFLTVFAGLDMNPKAMSSGEMLSYEMEIMTLAKEMDKKMDGLETAEFQMSMFDSIPYEAQAKMLVESIRSSASGDEELERMIKLYKDQDINGMIDMMQTEEQGIGHYEDLLLVSRNKNWIPVMANMMSRQRTFFAVGAGHLGGEMGVVALLRQAGYTLSPVRG